jgi:hypothetical protein
LLSFDAALDLLRRGFFCEIMLWSPGAGFPDFSGRRSAAGESEKHLRKKWLRTYKTALLLASGIAARRLRALNGPFQVEGRS